jgi:hypothetical protein
MRLDLPEPDDSSASDAAAPGGPRRVLIAGLPRSGTTWIANALAQCEGATLVHEPDNDRNHVEAMAAKARLGRQPVLRAGDRADGYGQVFLGAFGQGEVTALGERRRAKARQLLAPVDVAEIDRVMGDGAPRSWPWRLAVARWLAAGPEVHPHTAGPRLVKTVHGSMALRWLRREVEPDATLVIVRHPANVIGSWRDLGWGLQRFGWRRPAMWAEHGPEHDNPGPHVPATFIERGAWQFGLLANALLRAAEEPGVAVIDHEEVLADPVPQLEGVARGLGLSWTEGASAWVVASDRPGEGYELARVADEQRGRWRTRLAPDELAVVASIVDRFDRLRGRWPLT